MNHFLDKIATLLASNKLSLNKENTFGTYADSVPQKIVLKINEAEIKRVEYIK